jgi:hypothetical protein
MTIISSESLTVFVASRYDRFLRPPPRLIPDRIALLPCGSINDSQVMPVPIQAQSANFIPKLLDSPLIKREFNPIVLTQSGFVCILVSIRSLLHILPSKDAHFCQQAYCRTDRHSFSKIIRLFSWSSLFHDDRPTFAQSCPHCGFEISWNRSMVFHFASKAPPIGRMRFAACHSLLGSRQILNILPNRMERNHYVGIWKDK